MSDLTKVLKDFGFNDELLERISSTQHEIGFHMDLPDIDFSSEYTESENAILDSSELSSSDTVSLSPHIGSLRLPTR